MYIAAVTNFLDRTNFYINVTNIHDQDLKADFQRMKNFCGITVNVAREPFLINVAKLVTDDMAIFRELPSDIFEHK